MGRLIVIVLLFGNFSNILKEIAQGIKLFHYKNLNMSNSIHRFPFANSWFLVGGMSALTVCLMGLIFFLVKSYPGILYETLNLYLNDPKVDRLVIEVKALEDQKEDLIAELQAHKDYIGHYYDGVVLRPVALGLMLGILTGILLKCVFFLG